MSDAPQLRQLLADTSTLIEPPTDDEAARHGLAEAEWAISSMSIAELHKGALLAADDEERALRLRRLATVEARYEPLPFGTEAARILGRYMAEARRGELALRARDAIIAATAETHGLPVLTRDGDFHRFGAPLISLRSG